MVDIYVCSMFLYQTGALWPRTITEVSSVFCKPLHTEGRFLRNVTYLFYVTDSCIAYWRRQWQPTPVLCLGNPGDWGAWWAAIHGVARSRTRLSDFTFPFHFHALEKEMATHSSVPAWRIPGTGEPGGLPSMGSHRVGHDWSDLAAAAAAAA